jgi:glycosyltransferase involved in cell wall biosynthesis
VTAVQGQGDVDLIVGLAWESWGGPRRGEGFLTSDRFVRSVVADDRLRRILIVNATRSLPALAARRLTGQRTPPAPASHASVTTPLRLRRNPPTQPAAVERSMRRYAAQVTRQAERAGLRQPVMVTTNPLVAGFAPFSWPVTYFAFDDWVAHPRFTHLEAALLASYERLAASGRPVAAVSQTLLDRLDPSGPSIVVPNGLESAEWRQLRPAPSWVEPIDTPRAVYVGGLDERMDTELLTAAIDARPQVSFVLVGNGHDREPYSTLGRRANVTVHGSVDRDELTAVVAACDVGLVPHRRNELTESMSPLKVYEYLAAGLPVAAVDLEPMRGIDDRVMLAEDASSADDLAKNFIDALDRALAAGARGEQQRLAFLDSNDWKARHRRIIDLALGDRSGTDL